MEHAVLAAHLALQGWAAYYEDADADGDADIWSIGHGEYHYHVASDSIGWPTTFRPAHARTVDLIDVPRAMLLALAMLAGGNHGS